ncbi:MAG TPA: CDP-alcohol phosphatidyltransferase family protein, partial [Chroococcales cyanobacterium]
MTINIANLVTVARVFLGLGTLSLLWLPGENMRWLAFGLTIVVIWADGLDGFLARKLNQSSKLGGILDIAGDRVVEMSYLIVFAVLNWIPVWVPLLFLFRGTFVDAIRSDASEKGYTAFGAKTMMQSAIGKFIVASNFMRFTYAVVKAVAFCLVIAAHTEMLSNSVIPAVAIALVYTAAAFCV